MASGKTIVFHGYGIKAFTTFLNKKTDTIHSLKMNDCIGVTTLFSYLGL